jgi:hypothetical protein
MGIIKDCPRSSMEKCTDKYGCQGACKAVEQFEKEWREEQEPENWMKECADFWDHYTYITEAAQEKYEEEAQMWLKKLRTAPRKEEWVGLTEDDLQTIFQCLCISGASFNTIALAVEAKLKEKNT